MSIKSLLLILKRLTMWFERLHYVHNAYNVYRERVFIHNVA